MCLGSSLYFFGKAPLQYPHTRFHVLVFGLTVFWNGRKVSWLRRFLWWTNWSNKCGQTMAIMYEHMKRIQECWVQQHKAFFCAQSVASIRLTVWKWSGESRHPGPFHTCLKTFVAPFLRTRLTAPGSPRMAKCLKCFKTWGPITWRISARFAELRFQPPVCYQFLKSLENEM